MHFFSFEMVGVKGVYTTKTDIWGVGCLVIEMLEGQRPYRSLGLNDWMTSFEVCTSINWFAFSSPLICMKILKGKAPPIPIKASPETSALLREKVFVWEDKRLSAKEWLAEPWLVVRGPYHDEGEIDEKDE